MPFIHQHPILVGARRARRVVLAGLALAVSMLTTPLAAQGAMNRAAAEGYIAFVGGLLGLEWTPAQRTELLRQVGEYYATGNREAIATVENAARNWERARAGDPDARAVAFATARAGAIQGLAEAARTGAADSKWLLEQYYAADPILAPGRDGSIPLVRSVVDAAIDIDRFMQGEIHRRALPPLDARARQQAYRLAAQRYPSLSTAQQLELAKKPAELASTLGHWKRMGPELRTMVRRNMGAQVTPAELASVQSVLDGGRSQAWGMMQGQIDAMKANSDMIMGRGTTWNATLGRWEQQGGIVTEYDGRVRVP